MELKNSLIDGIPTLYGQVSNLMRLKRSIRKFLGLGMVPRFIQKMRKDLHGLFAAKQFVYRA